MNKFLFVLISAVTIGAQADVGTLCGDFMTRGFKISQNGRMAMQGFDGMGASSSLILDCKSMGQRFVGMALVDPIVCQGPGTNVQISLTTLFGSVTGQVYSAAGVPAFQGICVPYNQ